MDHEEGRYSSPPPSVGPPSMGREPGAVIGGFRLIKKMPDGGMASIHEAVEMATFRRCVVKLIKESLRRDPESKECREVVRRFLLEIEAMERCVEMNRRCFPQLYASGCVDKTNHYIAMELVEGRTLRDILHDAQGGLPVDTVLDYAGQLVSALHVMHGCGIIHRDLKPPNIIIRPDGSLVVLDFGIVRFMGPRRDTPHDMRVAGSPHYFSPEQIRGDDPDARTDVWQLGVILYQACVGRKPFEGESVVDVVQAILFQPVPSIIGMRTGTPPFLVEVIERCLQKDPAQRFQSADEVRAALSAGCIQRASHVGVKPESVEMEGPKSRGAAA